MPNATATETAVQFQNASSGFASSMELTGVIVFVLYAVAILAAANFVSPWLARSTIVSNVGRVFVEALQYAIKGLAATAVIGVAALPVWFVATAEPGTRSVAFRYGGYAIVAFAALVVFGWLADNAVARFINAHPDYDEWGDLFPESDDTEDDVPEVAD